ncbi:MAG: NfeD family protein [Prevotella sp.]|nr:NfeD family protein [Prevotella sp.]
MIDYFLQHLWQAWVLVSLACLILELTNGDLYVLCFSIGALCAMVASLLTDSIVAQIVVFAVCSLLSIIFVRPVALKWLHRGDKDRVSNADAIIGREGRVSATIEAGGYGRVAIDGDDWKAQAVDGNPIEKGIKVRVVRIDSIIVTVEKI